MKFEKNIFIISYICIIGIAEYILIYHSIIFGLIIHILLLLSLISLALIKEEKISIFLQALALVSLLRIISASIPLIVFVETIPKFFIIYTPLLLAAFLFLSSHKIKKDDVGFVTKNFKLQIIIGLTGIIFGFIGYIILKENILIESTEIDLLKFIIFFIVLVIFTGFTEELIFRGILLKTMSKIFNPSISIVLTSVIFMILHIWTKSIPDLIFVFFVSIFYSYVFLRTKNIIGISLSHGFTNVVEFFTFFLEQKIS